eukprot:4920352-Amphidinium_carterae.1
MAASWLQPSEPHHRRPNDLARDCVSPRNRYQFRPNSIYSPALTWDISAHLTTMSAGRAQCREPISLGVSQDIQH